jgi:hypothetical protein
MPVEHREAEWAELEAKAVNLLENSALAIQPIRAGPLLRLWEYPSFGQYRSWTVFNSKHSGSSILAPFAREVTWDRPTDSRRLLRDPLEGLVKGFHTRPSIDVRDQILSESELALHLKQCPTFSATINMWRQGIVLDGTWFGFRTYGPLARVELSWSSDGPSEWRDFIDWVSELRTFLRYSLGSKE